MSSSHVAVPTVAIREVMNCVVNEEDRHLWTLDDSDRSQFFD